MSENIVHTTVDHAGVNLIYLRDKELAGIHVRGLTRLLNKYSKTEISNQTVSNAISALEGVSLINPFGAEILTEGGMQGVKFIFETDLPKVLRKLAQSKRTSDQTKDAAWELLEQLAAAGFKLYAMLHVAPDVLQEKVRALDPRHNPTVAKLLMGVVEDARPWQEMFDAEWRAEAMRITGWQWQWRCMSQFINETVWCQLPDGFKELIDQVNPYDKETGCRENKIHQHLDPDLRAIVEKHVETVKVLMQVSYDRQNFWNIFEAKFGKSFQPSLWMSLGYQDAV